MLKKIWHLVPIMMLMSVFFLPQPTFAESCECVCTLVESGPNAGQDIGCKSDTEGGLSAQEACDSACGGTVAGNQCNSACAEQVSDETPAGEEKPAAPTSDVSSRASATLTLTNPLAGAQDIRVVIGRVIRALMTLAGALALLAFIWGGIQMMTSAGNASKHEDGKKTLIWATVGLAIIFTAYALVNTVITALTSGSV